MNHITINNLFDYIDNDVNYTNFYYYIGNNVENTLIVLGIVNDKIITYSNEWLYLIKTYYENKQALDVYNNIVNCYYTINNLSNKINYVPDDVVILISSFSTGTAHGYTFILYAIDKYLTDYKHKKVLIFNNSQQGILDLINHAIPNEKIISITNNQVYKINKGLFIPNIYHVWCNNTKNIATNIIKKIFYIENYEKYTHLLYKNLCIIKNTTTTNITNFFTVTYENSQKYADENNCILINPTDFNEVDLINILFRCKKFHVTWGTSYQKNYIYLSEICEKIICLYPHNFVHEYTDIYFDDKTDVYSVTNTLQKIKKLNKKNNDNFDWETYLDNYEDLRNAGINTQELALQHWYNCGSNEGRTDQNLNNDFDWKTYLDNYQDLRNAGINTRKLALQHWNNFGRNEGRTDKK